MTGLAPVTSFIKKDTMDRPHNEKRREQSSWSSIQNPEENLGKDELTW